MSTTKIIHELPTHVSSISSDVNVLRVNVIKMQNDESVHAVAAKENAKYAEAQPYNPLVMTDDQPVNPQEPPEEEEEETHEQ